jgi:DNA-binding winged helix-turn-helix (wHTH) protein
VWGREYETFDLVKWHISNLRKKLKAETDEGANEDSSFIVTVRGYGYRYRTPSEEPDSRLPVPGSRPTLRRLPGRLW